MILFLLGSLAAMSAAETSTGRVFKVLPLLLDAQGRDAITPSLYDRDAYQAQLRAHPEQSAALRVAVLWNAAQTGDKKIKLRVELRGVDTNSLPRQVTLEQEVMPKFFRQWSSLTLGGADYKNFGAVSAWHATLWSGDQMLAEQKSFLW
jgi:hypothetical protein